MAKSSLDKEVKKKIQPEQPKIHITKYFNISTYIKTDI